MSSSFPEGRWSLELPRKSASLVPGAGRGAVNPGGGVSPITSAFLVAFPSDASEEVPYVYKNKVYWAKCNLIYVMSSILDYLI